MTLIIDQLGRIHGNLRSDISNVEHLLADLQQYAGGIFPTPKELYGAPVIDEYRLRSWPIGVMAGYVSGHPSVADGPGITSRVKFLAEPLGWVRTESRLYRLGTRRCGGRND